MLRIIQRYWMINWAEQWQYRANQLMYPLYTLFSPVVYLVIWLSVANTQGDVKGLTANDFMTYYLVLLLVATITTESVIYIFEYKIRLGTLSNELLLPVHPLLTNTLINILAYKTLSFLITVPIWIGLVFIFKPNFQAVTPASLLLALPSLVMGFAINFLLGSALTCLAFWTTRVYSIADFYFSLVTLLSGQFVPLELMPGAVQTVASYLPFQFITYFPIQVILNRLAAPLLVQKFILELVWVILSYLIFHFIWRTGLKRFSAVGA